MLPPVGTRRTPMRSPKRQRWTTLIAGTGILYRYPRARTARPRNGTSNRMRLRIRARGAPKRSPYLSLWTSTRKARGMRSMWQWKHRGENTRTTTSLGAGWVLFHCMLQAHSYLNNRDLLEEERRGGASGSAPAIRPPDKTKPKSKPKVKDKGGKGGPPKGQQSLADFFGSTAGKKS